MICLRGLSKWYGDVVAVDDITADVFPGRVTALLGPNGSGKSTVVRLLTGAEQPTTGLVTIGGHPPLPSAIGTLPYRASWSREDTVYSHLTDLAAGHRVDRVLDDLGLTAFAHRAIDALPPVARQLVRLTTALLGDPDVLILDDPLPSLDTVATYRLRGVLRAMAAAGRIVLFTATSLAEAQLVADHAMVIGDGRMLADLEMAALLARVPSAVRVSGPDRGELHGLVSCLASFDARVEWVSACGLRVTGISSDMVGDLAHDLGVRLHELCTVPGGLEDAVLPLSECGRRA